MRIDVMPSARIANYGENNERKSRYWLCDSRQRSASALFLLLSCCMLPVAESLAYYVGTSENQVPSATAVEEPTLTKDEKQTIVLFCRAALTNPVNREKFKDPVELRKICGALIKEFKRQRDLEMRDRK
uniref:Rubis-subs-bind domain-containing protein n=1 Tax=Heterorhabditis bacteriophora TaxID=37862 RepID=A0A1I7XE09_HETBA